MGGPTVLKGVSAVSGVVATRRETFELLGGLRDELRELSLVDYCLRREVPGCALSRSPTRGFGPSRRMDQSTI